MTTELAISKIDHLSTAQKRKLPGLLGSFLDTVAAATDRATHYNTREEQKQAILQLHKDIFSIDRGIYGLCLCLPGINDYSKQLGMGFFLDNPRSGEAILTPAQEGKLIRHLAGSVEPQRMIKAFLEFRKNRINNSRTRKLILNCLLGNKNLKHWSVKYRYKIRQCLQHAWGQNVFKSVYKCLEAKHGKGVKKAWTEKQKTTLSKYVEPYTDADVTEPLAFILGFENRIKSDPMKKYIKAKKNLAEGKGLPKEQLFYLRSRFHTSVGKDVVYELAKSGMTKRQKALVQKATKKVGVKVEFNPHSLDAVRLYIYAYEMGMTDEIRAALKQKAKKSAEAMFSKHGHIGIIVDCSRSMMGDDTQKNRPIAVSLAVRDMLKEASSSADVVHCGGAPRGGLVFPCGPTSLASALVSLLKYDPEIVYVLSDGYENAPAGRFSEVLKIVREMGINTPVVQVSPVVAAEKAGALRTLAPEVEAVPLSKPEGIGMRVLKSLLVTNLEEAIEGLARIALPQLEDI